MNIEISAQNTVSLSVCENNTALAAKSGSLPVFATPFMCAAMEQAASELCEKYLENGYTTVGTALNIEHLAATAIGAKVEARATVTDVQGRKISFEVVAFDNAGIIGKGTHERFIIEKEKFMAKAESRKEKN